MRAITDGRRPRSGRQQLIRLLHLGRQLVHQIDPGGHQLGAVRGEMTVPDVERVQCALVAAIAAPDRDFSSAVRCRSTLS